MICFPNAKINIGLNIVSKRKDGYHNLETVFYPVPLKDILEFTVPENKIAKTNMLLSGTLLDIPDEQNICMKAYCLLSADYQLPNIQIHLHKMIPSGAGLGGGSSDAAFLLNELNQYFKLNIGHEKLLAYALELGADCAFFLKNKAVFANGVGNKFETIGLDLKGYYILIVKPEFSINTAYAFKNIVPCAPEITLKELIKQPVALWKDKIINDFELPLFEKYPELNKIKTALYKMGAKYASLSGSGSALFGLFKEKPKAERLFEGMFVFGANL